MNVVRGWHFSTPRKKFERKSRETRGYRIIEYVPDKAYEEKYDLIKKRRAEVSEELLRLENARADVIAYYETAKLDLDEALINQEKAKTGLNQALLKLKVANTEVTLKRGAVNVSRDLLRRNTVEYDSHLKLGDMSAAALQRATERLDKKRVKRRVGRLSKPVVYNTISRSAYNKIYVCMATRPSSHHGYKRWTPIKKLVELKIESPLFERIVSRIADPLGVSLEKS